MENQTNLNRSKTFDQDNRTAVEQLMPFTIILIVYICLGVLGNSTVLYIYLKKFKSYSDGRFFIPVLAVADMLACIVNCSLHLSITTSPLSYPSGNLGCKIGQYLSVATTATSIFILLLIAIDRYLKICKPFGRQMDLKSRKLCIIIIIIMAVILSSPPLALLEVSEFQTYSGYTVRSCFVKQEFQTGIFVFNLFTFLIIVAELIVISILYFRISNIIFKKRTVGMHAVKLKACSAGATVEEGQSDSVISVVDTKSYDLKRTAGDNSANQSQTDLQTSARKIPRSRIVVVFIAITITFALCFIPKVAVFVAQSAVDEFVVTNPHLISLFRFLDTFYICSNFINPFIYGCMDNKFQTELKNMC